MAELGSTGGNLDNILQYLLQRIEKVGIAEGVTGGGGTPDLSNYYTKTEVDKLIPDLTDYATQAWVTAQDYVNETIFRTFKSGYDNLAAAVSTANSYTDAQISKLNIDQYAKASALDQVVADVNVAFDAVYNKFADYALLAGDNTLTGTNTFKGYLNLKRGAGASGTLFLQDDSEHTNYATQNGVYFVVSDGGFAIHAHKDGSWKNEIAWIDMSSLRTSLKQGISVPDITVRGGDALFNGKATFNANTYINAHTYINANSYITGRLYLSNGNSGVYFVCENNATYLYKHNNWSYDRNVTFFKLSALVGELGTRSGLVEIGEQYSPGTLKIGNAYITYDSKNNALMVSDGSGGAVNIVAMGDVAAFGGLGSGFDTLTDLTLTNKLTAKSASVSGAMSAGGINVAGSLEGYINLADGNIEDCNQIKGDEIYANDFFCLDSNKISHISASGNETSGYVVKITIDGKTYAIDAVMLT